MLAAAGNSNRDRLSPLSLYSGARSTVLVSSGSKGSTREKDTGQTQSPNSNEYSYRDCKCEVLDRHYETITPKTGEIDANSRENWGD